MAPEIDRFWFCISLVPFSRCREHALVPESSCTTWKLVKFAVVRRGHLPNITLCTTRNSHSCYTLKVPRRRPDQLRPFSHLSRIRAPAGHGKPRLMRRTTMPARSGRLTTPLLGSAREEADDQADRRSAAHRASRWLVFGAARPGAPAALCPTRCGTTSSRQVCQTRIREFSAKWRTPKPLIAREREG